MPASDCQPALTPLPWGPCVRPAQVVTPTLGGCPLTAPGRVPPRQLLNPVRLDGRAPGAWRGPPSAASPGLWSGEGTQGRAQGACSLVTLLPQHTWLQDGLTVPSLHAGFSAEHGSQARAPGKGVCRHRPLWALPSPPGQCRSPQSSPRPLPRRDRAIRHQLQEAAGVASEAVACFFLPVNLGFRNEPRVGQPPTPGSSPGTSGPSPIPQSTRRGHLLGRGAGTVSTHTCLRVRHWGQWGSSCGRGSGVVWAPWTCKLGACHAEP